MIKLDKILAVLITTAWFISCGGAYYYGLSNGEIYVQCQGKFNIPDGLYEIKNNKFNRGKCK